MFDLIIIGAGPAGITAAIYAARKMMNFLLMSKDVGGQVGWSFCVDNYPGFPRLSGVDLVKKFRKHLKEFSVKVKEGDAKEIKKINNGFEVVTNDKSYETKTVIIASGKTPRHLDIPGEEKFLGSGVAYCAVCDSPYFNGKDVAIIGGGNAALDAVFHLENYANKIYLVVRNLTAEPFLIERIKKIGKVEVLTDTKVLEIVGDKSVSGVRIEQDGKQKILNVQGVFVEIGQVPNTKFVNNLVKLNESEEIIIDKDNMTNVPGIFAAGDVTDVKEKQIVISAGEGAKAVLSAWDYLKR